MGLQHHLALKLYTFGTMTENHPNGDKDVCNFSNKKAVKIRTGNTEWQAMPPGVTSLLLDDQFSNSIISYIAL